MLTESSQKPPAKTIENELFDAFVRVGAVSRDNSDDPVKVRAERGTATACAHTQCRSG